MVLIWAWPMRSMTDLRSEPPARSQEAWAWRRSWMRTSKSTPEALTAGRQTRVRKVFLEMGVPSRVANSRSPGLRRGRDVVGELVDQVGWESQGAGFVVLGVGLGEHPLRRWGSS